MSDSPTDSGQGPAPKKPKLDEQQGTSDASGGQQGGSTTKKYPIGPFDAEHKILLASGREVADPHHELENLTAKSTEKFLDDNRQRTEQYFDQTHGDDKRKIMEDLGVWSKCTIPSRLTPKMRNGKFYFTVNSPKTGHDVLCASSDVEADLKQLIDMRKEEEDYEKALAKLIVFDPNEGEIVAGGPKSNRAICSLNTGRYGMFFLVSITEHGTDKITLKVFETIQAKAKPLETLDDGLTKYGAINWNQDGKAFTYMKYNTSTGFAVARYVHKIRTLQSDDTAETHFEQAKIEKIEQIKVEKVEGEDENFLIYSIERLNKSDEGGADEDRSERTADDIADDDWEEKDAIITMPIVEKPKDPPQHEIVIFKKSPNPADPPMQVKAAKVPWKPFCIHRGYAYIVVTGDACPFGKVMRGALFDSTGFKLSDNDIQYKDFIAEDENTQLHRRRTILWAFQWATDFIVVCAMMYCKEVLQIYRMSELPEPPVVELHKGKLDENMSTTLDDARKFENMPDDVVKITVREINPHGTRFVYSCETHVSPCVFYEIVCEPKQVRGPSSGASASSTHDPLSSSESAVEERLEKSAVELTLQSAITQSGRDSADEFGQEKEIRQKKIFSTAVPLVHPNEYRVCQIWTTGAEPVPYYVVYHKDHFERSTDDQRFCLATGYGGFKLSIMPSFNLMIAYGMARLNFAFVSGNIHGGGEYGPQWHTAAVKQNRPKAFEDFAGICRSIVACKIVKKPSQLGIYGFSNGGLLMASMVKSYANLFGAVVIGAGVLDLGRYTDLGIGGVWTDEYGSPADVEMCEKLLEMSPLHSTLLPTCEQLLAVLIAAAFNDDRVHVAHSLKYSNMLFRKLNESTEPTKVKEVILRVYNEVAHFHHMSLENQILLKAEMLTFFAQHLGMVFVG